MANRLTILRFLIKSGLRPTYRTLDTFWADQGLNAQDDVSPLWNEIARVLMSHSEHLLVQDPRRYLFRHGRAQAASLCGLLLSSVYPPYQTRSLSERISVLHRLDPYSADDTQLVSLVLGHQYLSGELIHTLDHVACWSLLTTIASSCSRGYKIDWWLNVLSLLVKYGSDRLFDDHAALSCPSYSPLCSYLQKARHGCWGDSWWTYTRDSMHQCRRWIQLLSDAGLDLELYGRREHYIMISMRSASLRRQSRTQPVIYLAEPIIGLSYGPLVADWRLWFDCPYDQWAGDFWNNLERVTARPMPGAWVDEDDEERMIQRRNRPGSFKSLATSRRRQRRYLRFMQMNGEDARSRLGPLWDSLADINGKERERGWYNKYQKDWPPLFADVERMSFDEQDKIQDPGRYCRPCNRWVTLLEYYNCRSGIPDDIRVGMCHGADNGVAKSKNET